MPSDRQPRKPRKPVPDTNTIRRAADPPPRQVLATTRYDNATHSWADKPVPKSPPAADRAAYAELLARVKAERGSGVAVYPAVRRMTAPSETTAVAACRLLFWFGQQAPATDEQIASRKRQKAFGRNDAGVEDVRARGVRQVEPDDGGGWVDAVPASDRELALQTGLAASSVWVAIKRLCDAGWFEAYLVDGCRYLSIRPEVIAAAYRHSEKDLTFEGEFAGCGKAWFESDTATQITRIVTWVVPSLLDLTGRDHLAARALHQVIHNCRDGNGDWYHTTVARFGRSLGVTDDAMADVLTRLTDAGLIHRTTWRGRRGGVRHARAAHTLLAPASSMILSRMATSRRRSA
jgi:hypothetical protein